MMEKSTVDTGDFTEEDDNMPEPGQWIQLRHPSRVLPRVPRSVLARLVMVRPGQGTTASSVRKAGGSVKTTPPANQKKGIQSKAVSSPQKRPRKEEKPSVKPHKKPGSGAPQRKKADHKSAAKEYVKPTQRRDLADKSVSSEEGSWTVRLARLETNTLETYTQKLEECTDELQPRRARAAKKEVWYSEKDEDDIWISGEEEEDVWNSAEDDDWDSDEDEEFKYRPKRPKKMQNNTARKWSTERKFKKPGGNSKESTKTERTKSGVKTYPCPDCGIVFFQKSNLIEHQVFHKEADLPGVKAKPLHKNSNASVNRKLSKSKYSDKKKHLFERKSASKHPQTTQGKKPHACDECERSFNAYEMLIQHKKVHASEKAHVDGKKGVKKHPQKTPEKKPHPCDECEKSFNAYEMLLQHKRVHASEKASKGNDEKKNVSKPKSDSKTKVEKKASEKKPYPCSDCDLSFNSAPLLLQHQKAHTKEKVSSRVDEKESVDTPKVETKAPEKKPYPCSECDMSFNSSLVLRQHQNVHTKEKVSIRVDSKKSVGTPKVETKAPEKKPYPCTKCEMSFNSSAILRLHQKVHAKGKDSAHHDEKNTVRELNNLVTEKTSTCCESEKCSHDSSAPQQSKTDTSLKASICSDENRVSTLENNAPEKTSDESEKSLTPSSMPLQQQKLPTSAKSCTCNVCGKSFSKSSLLIIHRRVHSGYFACNECGKSFSTLSSLKVHQIKHVKHKSSKSYPCKECGKTFKIPSYLELHQRIHTLEKWRDKRGSGSRRRVLKKPKFGKKAVKGI
ncbi:uncharacterized protein LOC144817655 isoform X2 [Lissotriton helveticus]